MREGECVRDKNNQSALYTGMVLSKDKFIQKKIRIQINIVVIYLRLYKTKLKPNTN